jgi:hypothetical protein
MKESEYLVADLEELKLYNKLAMMDLDPDDGLPYEKRLPFFSMIYVDHLAKKTKEQYVFFGKGTEGVGEIIGGSLGKSELESFASNLVKICMMHDTIVGFLKDELKEYQRNVCPISASCDPLDFQLTSGDVVEDFLERNYLRVHKIQDREVLFPTEDFLDNQKVPKK